ncbi:M20 family metallopeptidase [Sporosarcina highlanderae]|uniref:M20 family metallopeptidase n=1 Tax=Sporosarcina highlanderae TaxID=3035916 RepID=A0ABT8JS90_9BACL|nr:M20 family metallopeptidase [Sporosarcina highlanderae]MDN4608018.1 M20 family metallopeptidase [Sporosarcina highlanderae]
MKEFLQTKKNEMLLLLERLVNIDSGSSHKEGIDEVGGILKELYEEMGFSVEVHEESYNGNNLVITYGENPSIIAVAHMDTVFRVGTAKDRPFTIVGDLAYGPGVIDMKASQVALLYAMKALKEGNPQALESMQIVLNGDEEIGSDTSRPLIEKYAEGKKYALIMEPARKDGSLVTARRGVGRYSVYVKGKAAHSGIEPQNGISAIEELAHKIIKLHALANHEEGISVSAGLIEGGESVNTIAPTAAAHVDVRIKFAEQAEIIDGKIREICSTSDVPKTSITLEGGINRPPMVKNQQTIELLEIIKETGAESGIEITDVSTGGGSDASFTSAMGIPTIDGLGPVGGDAHSEKEYLEIPSLVERTNLLAELIARLSARE